MRRHHMCCVVIVLFGVAIAEGASASQIVASQEVQLAQTEPAPVMQRQRAPGVPMAPRTDGIEPNLREHATAPYRTPRDERSQTVRDPDRDLPMPRGVPSIIAP